MARKVGFRAGLAVVLIGLIAASIRPARADEIVPGHVLVRVQAWADIEALDADYATTIEDHLPNTRLYCVHIPPGSDETDFARQLRTDPRVVYAEPDTFVGLPDVNGQQFHFAFDAGPEPGTYINQTAYQQVNLGVTPTMTTGAGVVVAVLDTGATFDHPALAGHYLAGYNAIQPNVAPLDLPDGMVNDGVGHGTMIAGIIARLAPDAQILPVRVLNGDGVGTMFDVVVGIHYAVTHGAKVLNMSFGTTQWSQALDDALAEAHDAGVVLVASAGNNGANVAQYPAACNHVVAVASVEADNTKSPFSNFGSFVAVVAPGGGIRSTYWTGGYASWSGTSFAAPFVTAEAALILSASPALGADDVETLICGSAHSVDALNPNYSDLLGAGIIDIEAAVFRGG